MSEVLNDMRLRLEWSGPTNNFTQDDIRRVLGELESLTRELAALRLAHTWTVATPATMPPVGEEVLVHVYRDHADGGRYIKASRNKYTGEWHGRAIGDHYKIDGTCFAAMPADAPAQDGGDDAEVTV